MAPCLTPSTNKIDTTDPGLVLKLIGAYIGATIGITYIALVLSLMYVLHLASDKEALPTLIAIHSLYGVTCCQTFNYYRSLRSQADTWILKLVV